MSAEKSVCNKETRSNRNIEKIHKQFHNLCFVSSNKPTTVNKSEDTVGKTSSMHTLASVIKGNKTFFRQRCRTDDSIKTILKIIRVKVSINFTNSGYRPVAGSGEHDD